ncbi:MAG: CoA transferase [Deltaproteobacteria bacterium]|nr:CoA transferase [Deltaproteobacteria bacterium]MBW2398370.1 CoA transferase [Deltaproteobacteria bacterium]
MSEPSKLPLEGIRILDLARMGPGLHSSQILGDFGADIIKLEPPSKGGKELIPPAVISRNTRSIRLNLKKPIGREILEKLTANVDVVVEGFKPGVAKRLGLDYDSLSQIKSDIICVSLSGFGQEGPYSQVVAHDLNYQSLAGIPHMTGDVDGPPEIPGNAIADDAGGISAALAIMMALFHKQRTGEGQFVDLAMVDTLLNMMLLQLHFAQAERNAPRRGQTVLSGRYAYYNIYQCKDGKYLSVGPFEPWFWAKLCGLLGVEEFAEHQHPETEAEARAQIERLREIFLTRDRDDWTRELMFQDTCVTPVLDLDEVMSDRNHRERGAIVSGSDLGEGFEDQVGLLFRMSKTPGRIRRVAPAVGQDTRDVLLEIGYPESEIDELEREISTA